MVRPLATVTACGRTWQAIGVRGDERLAAVELLPPKPKLVGVFPPASAGGSQVNKTMLVRLQQS